MSVQTVRVNVLDRGYVELVEVWGSDQAIVEAARQSTQKGFLGWGPHVVDEECVTCAGLGVVDDRGYCIKNSNHPYFDTMKCPACEGDKKARKPGDEKLLRFLWENQHSTPFEFAGITIQTKAPLFIFREWHRHRVPFGYSEASARYAPLPSDAFLVDASEAVSRSEAASRNAQAGRVKDSPVLSLEVAQGLLREEDELLQKVEDLYQRKLAAGFTKELARTHLTVSRYSTMRATANLRGWLAFLKLRQAPNAQKEIRVYADAVASMISDAFPRTWALFQEGRK